MLNKKFFASAPPVHASEAPHEYAINGLWEANEFSKFFGKMSDLYAIVYIASKKIQGISGKDLKGIREGVKHAFWQGGGSYVSFYDTIFEKASDLSPLRMAKVRYASPGAIELVGGDEALDEIDSLMVHMGDVSDIVHQRSKAISKTLERYGLKKAPPETKFESQSVEDFVKLNSDEILACLRIGDAAALFELCDSNTLVYSKIVLSIVRRAKDLHRFYDEGRIRPNH